MATTEPARKRRRERPRSTSRAVTPAVVIAAVRALDMPTAAEVAGAVGVASGLCVSGRAVRFMAEAAGILHQADAAGVRRYWVGIGECDLGTQAAVRDSLREQARAAHAGRISAATLEADTRARLHDLSLRHPAVLDPVRAAAIVDRVNDVARLHGWPLLGWPLPAA